MRGGKKAVVLGRLSAVKKAPTAGVKLKISNFFSAKAAAAQFKIGECYEKLNIPSSAREAYKRVIADYPSSEYKDRAQSNLNALK